MSESESLLAGARQLLEEYASLREEMPALPDGELRSLSLEYLEWLGRILRTIYGVCLTIQQIRDSHAKRHAHHQPSKGDIPI